MWKVVGAVAIGTGVLVSLLIAVAANATFTMKVPRFPLDARVVVTRDHGAVLENYKTPAQIAAAEIAAKHAALPAKLANGLLPRIIVDQTEFDFGTMDPLTEGKHAFTVRNTGDAPLKLEIGPTTCKCTVSGLSAELIAPGDKAEVSLFWNTGKDHLIYSHSATIYTNDPRQEAIELRVTGRVRMRIGADVSEINVQRMEPGQPEVAEVLLYSQIWDGFAVEDLVANTKGLRWEVEAVDPLLVPGLDARSVRKLRVTFPGDLPSGTYLETLHLKLLPAGETEMVNFSLPVNGKVLQRFSVYGSGIHSDGTVDLGTVYAGNAKRVKLLVKLRDEDTELNVADVQVSPAFLKVQLVKHEGEKTPGIYDLIVEVPDGVAPCQYLGNPIGWFKITTDHPRIPAIELSVSFAVVPAL